MQTIFHDPSALYAQPQSPRLGDLLTLRLRAGRDAGVERVFLRTAPDGEQHMSEAHPWTPSAPAGGSGIAWDCLWWQVQVKLHNRHFAYRFLLHTRQGALWLSASRLHRHAPTDHFDFRIVADFNGSPWVARTVFYQIFPERFADGDPSNNPRSGAYKLEGKPIVARAWNELPNPKAGAREFFGGDLEGVVQRLDHIHHRLGANGIYLNPIFTSPSSHKYDVASYHEVDPHLGGNPALARLRRAMDSRQMRLVLDVVPNHCGQTHPWFLSAQQDPKGPTADYFTFHHHPHDYECWLGHKTLPKLNYRSTALRHAMYLDEDSVLKRWLREPYRIDGWRLDVANMLARQGPSELGHKILRAMRKAVKSVDANSYFLGENFFDATSSLQGDELDATMNYRGFMMPLYHWLLGRDISALQGAAWGINQPLEARYLLDQWNEFRAGIPWCVALQQLNLLGSHDTPRVHSLCQGHDELIKAAHLLLFAYPGAPSIYYGDEIGMAGERDPDNRRPMIWEEKSWNHDILDFLSNLVRLRLTLPALQTGSFQALQVPDPSTVCFVRSTSTQRLVVLARRQEAGAEAVSLVPAAIPDGAVFIDLLHEGQRARVVDGYLPLTPRRCQLWSELP